MQTHKKIVYFKKLALENWAQFQNNSIIFPEIEFDKNNINIFYFLGENGVGKTRLFQAFRATLFGENDSSISKFKNNNLFELFPTSKKELIKEKLQNNEKIEPQNIVLTLEFIVTMPYKQSLKEYYKIERIWTYKNFKLSTNKILFDIERTKRYMERSTGGIYTNASQTKIDKLIEEFWPEAARDFFFFDGEKLQKMMEDPDKMEIKEKALKNSDYEPLEEHINPYLEKIMGSFEEEKGKKSRKKDLVYDAEVKISEINKKIQSKKTELNILIEQIEKEKKELNELEEDYNTNFKDRINELKRYEKAKPFIQKHNELTKKRRSIYNEIGNMLGDNKKKIYPFEWLLISQITDDVIKDLQEKKKNNVIPTKLDKATIEYIKNLDVCLCGNPIGDEERNNLQDHQDTAVNEDLNAGANTFLNFLINIQEKIADIRIELNKKFDEFIEVSKKIENLNIPTISTKIDSNILEKYLEMTEKITNLRNNSPILKGQKQDVEKLLIQLENGDKGKVYWENLRLKRLKQQEQIEKSDLYHLLTRESLRNLKIIKETLKEKIINSIKSTTNDTFLKLIPDPSKYLGIKIDENWQFGFIHKKNPNTPIFDPSKGQFHVIGLSFLKSISKVAQHNVPILFDTPFGRLSSRPKINIGKSLPKLFAGHQVMIFLTEEEARHMLEYISDKNGFEIFNDSGFQAEIEQIEDNSDLNERLERIKERDKIKLFEGAH